MPYKFSIENPIVTNFAYPKTSLPRGIATKKRSKSQILQCRNSYHPF